jgi:hypothetical protein
MKGEIPEPPSDVSGPAEVASLPATRAEAKKEGSGRELTLDSTVEEKLESVASAAQTFNSDLTQLIGRDDSGKLLFVAVHAKGAYAVALEGWLKRLNKRENAGKGDAQTSQERLRESAGKDLLR